MKKYCFNFLSSLKMELITLLVFCYIASYSQETPHLNDKLREDFIMAKGYSNVISLDASNIKQFWIDKSVCAKDNSIIVILNEQIDRFKSIPLKLQLANLDELPLCKVDVITDETDLSFSITSDKNIILATATNEEDFNEHHIVSTLIDFRDTDYINFLFESPKQFISIHKIILSFEPAASRRTISITRDNTTLSSVAVESDSADTFMIQGTQGSIILKEGVLVAHRVFTSSAQIKNLGTNPVRVRLGYRCLSYSKSRLSAQNFPYNNNIACLRVESAEKDNQYIITSHCEEWRKNCFIAKNAKEDSLDIPNTDLLEQKIVSVEQLENGLSKIILNAPLSQEIPKGELIRITNPSVGTVLYTSEVVLNPGKDMFLTSKMKKDYESYNFSPPFIPIGVYYIVPMIMTTSTNPNDEHSVAISNFSISY